MRTRFTLILFALSVLATAQIDINKIMQQHGGGSVKVEEDNEPFVPNSFIGSFRMENHRFKNGTEDKDSPTNVLYWSSEDMTLMQTVVTDQKESQDVKMLTDLKNKWQYMLMTDEKGEKTAMKSKKQKVTMDEEKAGEPDITKTTETRTIDGHLCTKTIVKSDDGIWTGWVAEDLTAPFEDMARNVKKGNESMTSSMGEMPGFPLEFEWVSVDGKDRTVTYIRDLQYGSVDTSAFSLDGYEVVEMPSYGQ